MDRPKLEVADVFRRYGPAYREKHGALLSNQQRRVMKAIETCRTAALGGHLEKCDQCGHERNCYNSCVCSVSEVPYHYLSTDFRVRKPLEGGPAERILCGPFLKLSQGLFRWWPGGIGPLHFLEEHQAQLAAGRR